MLGIFDPYEAFCIDQAVVSFGLFVKGQLEDIKGRNQKEIEGRRLLVLRRLLSDQPESRFRTPVATTT
jgi:hypothetical protein